MRTTYKQEFHILNATSCLTVIKRLMSFYTARIKIFFMSTKRLQPKLHICYKKIQ